MNGKRSSRSIPTGPGSRGGLPLPATYWSDWRAAHPEYQERERARCARRRALIHERRMAGVPSFTDGLRDIARREIAARGTKPYARLLGVWHTTVMRFVRDETEPRGDLVDAIVTFHGLYAVGRDIQSQRRAAKRANRDG